MTQADDPREPPSLGEIVREKTNDGLTILDFYIGAFEGELDGSTAPNRLEAAQDLLDMIVDHALLRRRWQGTALAIVLGSDLDLFRRIVRFQVDVVEGREEGLTLRRRVLLAEQLRNAASKIPAGDRRRRENRLRRCLVANWMAQPVLEDLRTTAGDGRRRKECGSPTTTSNPLDVVDSRKTAGANRDDRRSARVLLDDKEYRR